MSLRSRTHDELAVGLEIGAFPFASLGGESGDHIRGADVTLAPCHQWQQREQSESEQASHASSKSISGAVIWVQWREAIIRDPNARRLPQWFASTLAGSLALGSTALGSLGARRERRCRREQPRWQGSAEVALPRSSRGVQLARHQQRGYPREAGRRGVRQDVVIGGVTKHTLFVSNDNDFVPTVTDSLHPNGVANPNRFFVFAFDGADLPGFEPQHLHSFKGHWDDR